MSKYVRTEDGRIIEIGDFLDIVQIGDFIDINNKSMTEETICEYDSEEVEIIKKAETIKELCDEFVMISNEKPKLDCGCHSYSDKNIQIYGAIWTEWGLKYVAKMNNKGELELI